MSPSQETPPSQIGPHTPISERRPPPSGEAGSSTPLEALSEASQHYRQAGSTRPRPDRKAPFLVPLVAAFLVGVALTLAARFQYDCVATMRVHGEAEGDPTRQVRSALLDFAMFGEADGGARPESAGLWHIARLEPNRLTLHLKSPHRTAGLDRVRQVATDFVRKMEEEAAAARQTPGEAEQAVAALAAGQGQALSGAIESLKSGAAELPEIDPRIDRSSLRTLEERIADDIIGLQEQITGARLALEELETSPPAAHALVPTEVRQSALAADLGLQEDLKELEVELTLLKRRMLDVRAPARERLDELRGATEALLRLRDGSAERDDLVLPRLEPLLDQGVGFGGQLDRFTRAWTGEFADLRELTIDAKSGELLDLYDRVRGMLNDYVHQTSDRLNRMDRHVRAMAEDLSDDARLWVLYSNVVRSFRTLRQKQNRFQLAAGMIEPNSNIQLDAALRSATGLRRRSQQRIEGIVAKLEAEALGEFRVQRGLQLKETNLLLRRQEEAKDQLVQRFLTLREQDRQLSDRSEAFVEGAARSGFLSQLEAMLRKQLDSSEAQQAALRELRLRKVGRVRLELEGCEVAQVPVNLTERLTAGGLGAIVTLVALTFGQWWIGRRS